MELLKLNSNGNTELSDFKDPFTKEGVSWINISLHKDKSRMFREDCHHKATVYLKNGNTAGEHSIYANDVQELFTKIQIFIDEL